MIEVVVVIAFFAALLLAQMLPRFCLYGLAPALFLALGAFFVAYRSYFGFAQDDGTVASVVVPVLMWGLLLVGTVLFHLTDYNSWWGAVYVTILTALGTANPDPGLSGPGQVLQTVLTIFSIALIPVLTAAIVDAAVRARLARANGGPDRPMHDHLVVVGLGNLGTRVLTALHEAGQEVVAVDRFEHSRGVTAARSLGIPVVVGDPAQEAVLRAAWAHTCRTMLLLSSDDMRNLQTALLGRAIAGRVRVVLRLFDADFATRVERVFGLAISRSVSYLAAPAFGAAMMGRVVLDTIPVRRHVLLVAELPIGAGSPLEGQPVTKVDEPNQAKLLAVRTGRGAQTLWAPPHGRRLVRTDRILVVATRTGLGHLLAATRLGAPHDEIRS